MRQNQGIVRLIVLIVIGLLVLSYFGIKLRDVVNSDAGDSNFGYVKELVVNLWTNYLARPVNYLWNDIFLDLLWQPFVDTLQDIKNGRSNDLISPPNIDFGTNG